MDDERALFKIGCEIFIVQDDHLLLGKRKNCFGAGTWGLPGGHLGYGERLVDAAVREIQEELGGVITPTDLELASITDGTPTPDNDNHYVHAAFELRSPEFTPKNMEPERCEEWRYFALNDLPLDNIFIGHRPIIENYLKRRLYAK